MTIVKINGNDFIEFEHDDELYHLPTRFEVCPRCQGKGQHVNPAIDGNGITMEEWWGPDWDDESRNMYRSGGYDVRCWECHGNRVVHVPDSDRIEPALMQAYQEHQHQLAMWDAEDRAIRRMESGGDY